MWQSATAVVEMGKAAGVELNIVDVYNSNTAKELALIANFLISQVKTSSKTEIEIINDARK